MDGLEPRTLAGTEGASGLFWTPQSDAIGYIKGDAVFRVAVSGSTPQKLCEIPDQSGRSWMPSGDLIVGTFNGQQGRMFRVPGHGGLPVELPKPKATGAAVSYVMPVMLGDDRHFLYLGWALELADRAVYVGSLDGAEPVRLIASDAGPAVAPGQLLFSSSGSFRPAPVRCMYEISNRWAIQAERGAATGADVLFKTERGQ